MKRRSLVAVLAAAAITTLGSTARAESVRPDDPVLRAAPPERRNGVALGASGGIAFGGSSGYPNTAKLLENPDFYSSSPLLVGWATSAFLMGALSDWVSFGPMFTVATFESAAWKSTGWGAGFRAEVFPLLRLVPSLADTAVFAMLGVGSTELRAKGPYPSADGTQSFLGIGFHHEWRLARLLGGHAAGGPFVELDSIRAPSIERHWLSAGLRVVWYGGSVALDRR